MSAAAANTRSCTGVNSRTNSSRKKKIKKKNLYIKCFKNHTENTPACNKLIKNLRRSEREDMYTYTVRERKK